MKKICIIWLLILFAFSFKSTQAQDMSEAQRKERCENNKNRIAELETELRIIYADLSQTMEKKEIVDAKGKINYLEKMRYKHFDRDRSGLGDIGKDEWIKIERIAAQYNFNFKDCEKRRPKTLEVPMCLMDLSDLIEKKIKKAVSMQNLRPALIKKRHENEKLLASHKNNLIVLRCNEATITPDFNYSRLSGTWQSDWGPVDLNVSPNSVTGSWKQSGTGTGQITGGSFDGKTKKLSFKYSQAWNKKTGKVNLTLSETNAGYVLNGSWGHDDGSNSGNWSLKKNK